MSLLTWEIKVYNIGDNISKGVLAIRRIFSLVDMITKPKF